MISWFPLQFVTYEVVQRTLYSGVVDSKGKGLNAVNFVSGCAAGGCGTLASFPFDVLRTRLISQGEPKVFSQYIHIKCHILLGIPSRPS